MQKRIRSKFMWLALASLVYFILNNWGLLAPLGLTETSFNQLIDLVIPVLIALGIINDPHSKNHL